MYIKELGKPNSNFILVQDDYFARCSYVDNVGSTFYLSTNIDAPNYRLVKMSLSTPGKDNWTDVIPETDNV